MEELVHYSCIFLAAEVLHNSVPVTLSSRMHSKVFNDLLIKTKVAFALCTRRKCYPLVVKSAQRNRGKFSAAASNMFISNVN